MWSVDTDFNLITFNEPFKQIILLYSGKEISQGMSIFSAGFPPEQINRHKEYLERAFLGESFVEIEYTEQAIENWTEISFYPIRQGDKIIGSACHSRDITQRKKTEENIIESEKRLKESQALAHFGNWNLDFATGIATWSEEACLIYGIPPTENGQTHENWASFIHPDDLDYVMRVDSESKRTLSDILLNHRIVLKDGTIKHIHSQAKFEFDKEGRPIGLYGIAHDITEIKEKELLLQKSEAFSRSILNSLDSHIVVIDNSGCIVAANELWERFAIENGETTLERTGVGCNYYEVCRKSAEAGEELAAEVLQGLKEVMEEKKNGFYLEYPCDSPTEQRWFGMRVRKFEGDNPLLVISHQNIFERKLTEQKLEQQNAQLLKTNAELDRFVYSASHELRAPLTSVLGLVSLIEIVSKETDTLQYANMIKSSINRLDEFIKNILGYSRNNRTELLIEKIPIQETVKDMVHLLRNRKDSEGIRFEMDIEEQVPFYSDMQRFYTIIENLISNAIKYHKKEGLDRYIKIISKSDIENLHLSIEDNGIGIAPAYHHKLFDMFFRISGKIAGSGVGLYLVKEIINKLGGTIQIHSEEGIGTSFTIIIKNRVP